MSAERDVCLATGCDRPKDTRGLCSTHYSQVRRNRQFATDGPIPEATALRCDPASVTLDSLLARTVTDEHGCMIWQGSLDPSNGYPAALTFNGRRVRLHRLAAILSYGYTAAEALDVPPGIVTRHLCHTPACINPDHLVMGSHRQNVADMVAAGRFRHNRPHTWADGTCQRGHDIIDPTNVYVAPNGWRQCRRCRSERALQRRAAGVGRASTELAADSELGGSPADVGATT